MKSFASVMSVLGFAIVLAGPVTAQTFFFNTGSPDGRIATASRPSGAGKIEIESADDFVVSQTTLLNHATFTGLITSPPYSIDSVNLEIYRVFPLDSAFPPSGKVLTRVNSPSDIAFAERSSTTPSLTFSTTLLSPSFTAINSVGNGIHALPNSLTGGDGPITGQEVSFDITLHDGILLPAGHYFIVPQVLTNAAADFFWLRRRGRSSQTARRSARTCKLGSETRNSLLIGCGSAQMLPVKARSMPPFR